MSALQIIVALNILVAGAFGREIAKADCAIPCKALHPGYDPNNYLKIEVHASWDEANLACEHPPYPNLPPKTYSLLTIETPEEMEFLKCYLEKCKDTDEYWTSGKYDAKKGKYVWTTTGQDISMSWGWEHAPPNPASPQTRVTIRRTVWEDVSLRTAQEEDGLISVLCEKRQTTPCP